MSITIITTFDNINSSVQFFGDTSSYGQTFIAPAPLMQSMKFRVFNNIDNVTNFRAYVYEWDTVNNHPTGPQLFESSVMTIAIDSNPQDFLVPITLNNPLTIGNTYVAFFTATGVSNTPPTGLAIFAASANTYFQGDFVAFNTANFNDLFNNAWFSFPGNFSLAFELVFLTPIPCLHPDTLVTISQTKEKKISDLKAGDYILNHKGKSIPIVFNMLFDKSDTFVRIPKDTFKNNEPSSDLYIRKNHPILRDGKEINPYRLIGKIKGIEKVKLPESVPVWSICTKERTFVMMQGIPVATWSEKDITLNKKYTFTKF